MPGHAFDRGGREQRRTIGPVCLQSIRELFHAQVNVVLGRDMPGVDLGEAQLRQAQFAQLVVLEHEHDLVQRAMSGAALGAQPVDQ